MITCSVHARIGFEREVKERIMNAAEKGAFVFLGVDDRHGFFRIQCESMETVEALRKMENVGAVGWRDAETH